MGGWVSGITFPHCDTQVPILSENLDTSLSKLCWAPNGRYLVCGDYEGKVHIYEAGEVSDAGLRYEVV